MPTPISARRPSRQRENRCPTRHRRVSISGHYPSPAIDVLPTRRFLDALRTIRGELGALIADLNVLNSHLKSPRWHTSTDHPRPSAQNYGQSSGQGHRADAYPPTNDNPGGKLPRGKRTSRSPARSFSAASR